MSAKRPAKKTFAPTARGPLNGVRVIDLSRLVAGNVLTLQLADFGAEVIKIEPPEGDTLRSWRVKGIETAWKVYSRNKKSVALDLRADAGRAIVRELAKSAAILVESFRPGVLEDMGLSPDELHAINPSLVIVRISGWGQDGRYRHKPGFGTLIEGYSGFASMNGFADREPVLPPMYLADCMAALNGYGAVLVALREVEINGGKGQTLDLPLFDPLWAAICDVDLPVTFHVSTGRDPRTARGNGGAVINYAVHSLSPTMEPLVNLCASGVVERFPKLSFGSIEAGIGWVPWMLTAMDEAYHKHHMWVRPKLKALPSDYFRANAFASFGEDAPGLDLMRDYGLSNNFLWANDFPHHEGTWPHSAAAIERTMAKLDDGERARVLGLNAARVFKFDIPARYRVFADVAALA